MRDAFVVQQEAVETRRALHLAARELALASQRPFFAGLTSSLRLQQDEE
jgi:hypothetical protein